MNRFYVPRENIGAEVIRITDADDVRHFRKVLRIEKGEDVFISDGEGGGYVAAFEQEKKGEVLLAIRLREPVFSRRDRPLAITLACAVPKRSHFDEIVDKGTQLGVDTIVPLVTKRSLVSLEECRKKADRWQRVCVAAAKQSGVLFLPQLKAPVMFEDLLKDAQRYDLKILPNLSQRSLSLSQAAASCRGSRILVMIGPEGDFSADETRAALASGFLGVSLGASVLRVDTAAIATLSYLSLRKDRIFT